METNLSENERLWVDARDKLVEYLRGLTYGDVAILVVAEAQEETRESYDLTISAMVHDERLVQALLEHAYRHVTGACDCDGHSPQ